MDNNPFYAHAETPDYSHLIATINRCDDVEKLTTFYQNAQKKNVEAVKSAAYARLKSFMPSQCETEFQKEFWAMFSAYEDFLLSHFRPTKKLNKSREIAVSDGEATSLRLWVTRGLQVWTFEQFVKNGQSAQTAEALVTRYANQFDPSLVTLAKSRLTAGKITPVLRPALSTDPDELV